MREPVKGETSLATPITDKDAIRESHNGHNFPHINPKSIKPRKLQITLLSMKRSLDGAHLLQLSWGLGRLPTQVAASLKPA